MGISQEKEDGYSTYIAKVKPEHLHMTSPRLCVEEKGHSMAFQLPSASIEACKCSFFPQTIRDWNDLHDSLFSTAEMSNDCASKFASLVRSMDQFLSHQNPLVK